MKSNIYFDELKRRIQVTEEKLHLIANAPNLEKAQALARDLLIMWNLSRMPTDDQGTASVGNEPAKATKP